jgi:hypothetical protein
MGIPTEFDGLVTVRIRFPMGRLEWGGTAVMGDDAAGGTGTACVEFGKTPEPVFLVVPEGKRQIRRGPKPIPRKRTAAALRADQAAGIDIANEKVEWLADRYGESVPTTWRARKEVLSSMS